VGPAEVIVVDTSAIIAIQLAEPEREEFLTIIAQAGVSLISSGTLLEARMVLGGRRGQESVFQMNAFLSSKFFQIVPPGSDEMEAAYQAFIVYGKGNGHPASLNFGDLFAYALAKTRGLPLLFKGNDFSQTDIRDARDGGQA
jgi:ribonuclease VapC